MKALYERIEPQESSSFKAFAYEKDEFDNPWHYHPEYELTYILSSRGVRYTGNSFENFEENDFVLLGPNLPHCWKNTGVQTGKSSAIVIHWGEALLGTDWIKHHEFDNIHKLLQLSEKGIKFNVQLALKFKEKLESLLTMSPFDKLLFFLQVLQDLSKGNEFNVLCDRNFEDQLNHEDHERINRVHHFVRKNYKQKITLRSIADEIHMTEESFSRFFSKLMSKPFFYFLNEYRINAACKMLIESDISVTQVSYECGFESLPFFYRQFKRYKASSPKQFRAAYQRINPL
ncbi:MAG: AraC family transcriptional regulator [Marivirga sp.]|nr:AraC family transcriptional regulator [Marivirga sp.]